MAFPAALIPALGFLAKGKAAAAAGGAAKAALGGSALARTGSVALKALNAGQSVARNVSPLMGKKVGRFAGKRVQNLIRGFTPEGFAKNYGMPMGKDLGMAIAPDIMFGGLTMAMTPGDLGDKAIAGLGTAVGGAAGGLGARGLIGAKSNMGIMMSELGGGLAGDMVGMNVADSMIRAKNGGVTPMEQQGDQQMEELRQQIINDYIRNGQ